MVIFRCQRQGEWTMVPEDDKKQKRIGSKARLVSRKMLKTEDEDEEQSWGKWSGTVKTAAKAPEDRDPGARSSRQDRKGDAQEPEVACKTASRCRQDRKDNAQEPEVAGRPQFLVGPQQPQSVQVPVAVAACQCQSQWKSLACFVYASW